LSRNLAFIAVLMDSGVEFIAVDNPHANRLTVHILAAVAQHASLGRAPAPLSIGSTGLINNQAGTRGAPPCCSAASTSGTATCTEPASRRNARSWSAGVAQCPLTLPIAAFMGQGRLSQLSAMNGHYRIAP
jgi:hypothetical protein